MTAFLAAILLGLIVGGALVVVWREQRQWFRQAVTAAAGVCILAGAYVWLVMHGHELLGDRASVGFSGLRVVEVAGSFRLGGEVINRSQDHAISAVPLTLLVERCDDARCDTLREVDSTLVMSVPPGETRPFSLVFSTSTLPPGGPLSFRLAHEGPRTHRAVQR